MNKCHFRVLSWLHLNTKYFQGICYLVAFKHVHNCRISGSIFLDLLGFYLFVHKFVNCYPIWMMIFWSNPFLNWLTKRVITKNIHISHWQYNTLYRQKSMVLYNKGCFLAPWSLLFSLLGISNCSTWNVMLLKQCVELYHY